MGSTRAKGRVGGEERLTASEWLYRRAADWAWQLQPQGIARLLSGRAHSRSPSRSAVPKWGIRRSLHGAPPQPLSPLWPTPLNANATSGLATGWGCSGRAEATALGVLTPASLRVGAWERRRAWAVPWGRAMISNTTATVPCGIVLPSPVAAASIACFNRYLGPSHLGGCVDTG